jgi:hypothetical protein
VPTPPRRPPDRAATPGAALTAAAISSASSAGPDDADDADDVPTEAGSSWNGDDIS